MILLASPDQPSTAQLIAKDYAAMGFTHWRCNSCALKHSNEAVAEAGPHCDECDADLHPQTTPEARS